MKQNCAANEHIEGCVIVIKVMRDEKVELLNSYFTACVKMLNTRGSYSHNVNMIRFNTIHHVNIIL